jgi:hypothetical protein
LRWHWKREGGTLTVTSGTFWANSSNFFGSNISTSVMANVKSSILAGGNGRNCSEMIADAATTFPMTTPADSPRLAPRRTATASILYFRIRGQY